MAALRYVGVAAVIFAIPLAYWARQDTPALPAFEEVRTDVYRLNLECRSPILATMSVAAWLINVDKNSWVLVDSGLDIPANIEALVAGLREKMGLAQDSLKLILSELVQAVITFIQMPEQCRCFETKRVFCSHTWTR